MVTVTFEMEVMLPDTTAVATEDEAVDTAYEVIDSAPAFDGIDAEGLAHHLTATEVDGVTPETIE
ncbi:hypothetical protein ACFQDD_00395 [Halorubrum pallidum]|uniref:Uncharacterized protein n=1 Tax=Halorubrum pallidum TaxID=1526114 RepID=A0ABD5SXK8_9EURY